MNPDPAGLPARAFEPDLRIVPTPAIAALGALGMVFLVLGEVVLPAGRHGAALNLALLSYTVFGISAGLYIWRPGPGRWSALAGLVAVIYAAHAWLAVPGLAGLLCVPVALAAALIGLPAAFAVALVTSVLLFLPQTTTADGGVEAAAVALVAIWSILAVMFAAYRPLYRLAAWAWGYYERAGALLQEARDRRSELEQALEDLVQANVQLTRLNTLAQGLRQAAEDARTAKEQFVANVSHELRTPLNMVVGFSEMIMQGSRAYGGPLPSALLADLSVIHRNAMHLSDLIDDVLDLSQIEADQVALVKEWVAFREIVDASVEAMQPLYRKKGLYLKVTVEEDLPLVLCDRTRMREVLLNLLSNAGRFTEVGGVQLSVWHRRDDLMISVADSGRGIAEKDLGRLFQPFQQLDGSIRRRFGGTGLGLSISKRFVELHEGRIGVESQEGTGTTFTIRLPLGPPAPAADAISGAAYVRGLQPGWEYLERTRPSAAPKVQPRPRLVVVESGDILQRTLGRYLDGVEIAAVDSLEAALDELAAQPARALLVNAVSIATALPRLQAAALPRGLPGIVCSVPDVRQAAGGLGLDGYLVKPVSRDALLSALDRLPLRGNKILVVDDEPEALRLFRRMLASSERGYRVLRAGDGEEGLRLLREERPDAVLLDLVMPGMDGFRLLEARSQDPALRDIPVIASSARDPSGHPVVSSALAVTCAGGLSAPRLLACIKAVTEILSGGSASGAPTAAPPD